MTGTYMELKVLSRKERALFRVIESYVEALMRDVAYDISCHEVCQRLEAFLPTQLKWYQGYFGDSHQHSWIHFVEQPDLRERFIIDPYPVAMVGGPILVDTGSHLIVPTPWNDLYREADLTDVIPNSQRSLLRKFTAEVVQ
jgi:hypothetical protein